MSLNLKALKKGAILSETSFYVVKELQNKVVVVVDDFGNELQIGNPYVERILQSADYFNSEVPKNMTELAEIFVNSPRVALTVCYTTKDTAKTKKDYTAEVQEAITSVQNAKIGDVNKILTNLIENPISKFTPGALRIMRGRHYGSQDDFGRVHFIDMELTKDPTKDYDTRQRQVDPRTIQYIIVGGVKYTLK
jgi:hypothetical protein